MSLEAQRQELERILKEIYNEYSDLDSYHFYYKLKGRKLSKLKISSTEDYYLQSAFRRFNQILFNPQLEYALYNGATTGLLINPSLECERPDLFASSLFIGQFMFLGSVRISPFDKLLNDSIMSHSDPLAQLLAYRYVSFSEKSHHVYVCIETHIIEPDAGSLSIFHGKKGLVAYCVTLSDYMTIWNIAGNTESIEQQFQEIRCRVKDRLKEFANGKNREEYCDIDVVKDVIHDEIEEANRLMQKYGIIRVAFPLD